MLKLFSLTACVVHTFQELRSSINYLNPCYSHYMAVISRCEQMCQHTSKQLFVL